MEITDQINKHRVVSIVIQKIIQTTFYLIRKYIKRKKIENGSLVIISLLKLGDTVLTIPAIKEIQKYYNKKIFIICFPENIPIYKAGLINIELKSLNHSDFYFNGRFANHIARKTIHSINPEIIIDMNGVMSSATLIFTAKAKIIVGMTREQFKTIYDIYIPENRTGHLTNIYLKTIAPLVPVKLIENDGLFQNADIRTNKIIIHPFAGWKAKEWNLKKFIILGKLLNETYDVIFITPKDTIDQDVIIEIQNAGLKFLQIDSVDKLINEIMDCFLVIGNDSGPIHIANMLGKQTFSIFGPTNPKFSKPIGNNHAYCKNNIKCMPQELEEFCYTNGGRSGCPAFECMNSLSVDQVYETVNKFLKAKKDG